MPKDVCSLLKPGVLGLFSVRQSVCTVRQVWDGTDKGGGNRRLIEPSMLIASLAKNAQPRLVVDLLVDGDDYNTELR